MNLPLFKSILRPITRVLVGVIAIPIFRFIMRRVFRLQDLDPELEKDLEQWFRGALLLLAATANMEHLLFGWVDRLDWMDRMDWLTMGLRLMLAIGVIEAMPDQELFAVIHPGPPKLKPGRSMLKEAWKKKWALIKGFVCQHLNRSSPVLAMMAAIVGAQLLPLSDIDRSKLARVETINSAIVQPVGTIMPAQWAIHGIMHNENLRNAQLNLSEIAHIAGEFQKRQERWMVGWCCYLLAITQYLIIGLVTSRDRALDVLSEFDRAVAERREQIVEEFELGGKAAATSSSTTHPVPVTSPPEANVNQPAQTTPDADRAVSSSPEST